MKASPITVSSGDHVAHARWLFKANRIGGLPVVDDGKLVGVFTLIDLKRVPKFRIKTTKIGDVMSKEPYVVYPDEELSAAVKLMNDKHVGRICVVSRRNHSELVGLLSRSDLGLDRLGSKVKCKYCGRFYSSNLDRCPYDGSPRG